MALGEKGNEQAEKLWMGDWIDVQEGDEAEGLDAAMQRGFVAGGGEGWRIRADGACERSWKSRKSGGKGDWGCPAYMFVSPVVVLALAGRAYPPA